MVGADASLLVPKIHQRAKGLVLAGADVKKKNRGRESLTLESMSNPVEPKKQIGLKLARKNHDVGDVASEQEVTKRRLLIAGLSQPRNLRQSGSCGTIQKEVLVRG
jgi:hypothetical protein